MLPKQKSRPSASKFKSFSKSLEQFFITVGQNKFGNKIPFLWDIPLLQQKILATYLLLRDTRFLGFMLIKEYVHCMYYNIHLSN